MKKLIFVDNDDSKRANKDCNNFVKPFLQAYGNVSEEITDQIEVLPDLYKEDQNKLYKMFYSGEYAILTWSVYTPTPFHNSKAQLLRFLRVAGSHDIRDVVYIDFSGELKRSLSMAIGYDDIKSLYSIIKAIETNYIITLKDTEFVRLRISFGYNEVLKSEPINIKDLL